MKGNLFNFLRELKSSVVSKRSGSSGSCCYIPVSTNSSSKTNTHVINVVESSTTADDNSNGTTTAAAPAPTDNTWPPSPPRRRPPQRSKRSRSLNVFGTLNRFILFSSGKQRHRTKYTYLTLSIGLTAIMLGVLLIAFSPYEIVLKLKTTFSEGGEGFELWRRPPVNVYLKVYLFNITNRDEFLAGKEKLKVQEVGPYIYREIAEHANITFNHENGTVSAVPRFPLQWMPELNSGKEDDVLMLPNVALLSIANVMATSTLLRSIVNLLILQTNTQPIVRQTVKEFMFGYESDLVTLGNRFFPSWIKFDKLGLIDRMYDFEGDVSVTYTGETDMRKSGLFASYNNRQYLPQWQAPCNRLHGASDGTKFPASLSTNDTLLFYRKSLCRTMPVTSNGETSITDGLRAIHFRFPDNALDNGHDDPDNACFCRKGRCLPRGLLDVQECYYGFPIALSYPHFHHADPKLLENIEGSNPDPKLHETEFRLNQETGTPLRVAVRMQINMALQDLSSVNNADSFSNMVVPLLWTEVEMPGLPTGLLIKLFLLLRFLPILETILLYSSFICGAVLTASSICALTFVVMYNNTNSSSTQQYGNSNSTTGRSIVRNKKSKKPQSSMMTDLKKSDDNEILEFGNSQNISSRTTIDIDSDNSNDDGDSNDGMSKDMDVYYCSLLLSSTNDEEAS